MDDTSCLNIKPYAANAQATAHSYGTIEMIFLRREKIKQYRKQRHHGADKGRNAAGYIFLSPGDAAVTQWSASGSQ